MIQSREKLSSLRDNNCPKCGGSGTIEVFRNDWEDFDEIECDHCKVLRA